MAAILKKSEAAVGKGECAKVLAKAKGGLSGGFLFTYKEMEDIIFEALAAAHVLPLLSRRYVTLDGLTD